MSLSAAQIQTQLALLLPQGRFWDVFREGPDNLLAALSQEPARLLQDADAQLETAIPDTTAADLDHFERIVGAPDTELTDAERLARIQALLFGRRRVDLPYLQQVVQAMAADDNVLLLNRAYGPGVVGTMTVGDSMAVGNWLATWACELYPTLLDMVDPNAFVAWAGYDSLTNNDQYSPVTLTQVADSATLPVGPDSVVCDVTGTSDDMTLRLSLWMYAVNACQVELGFIDRSGAEVSDTFSLPAASWHKLETVQPIGSGATQPQAFMRAIGSPADVWLSWAHAHRVDAALESRIRALFPIHTRGVFVAQGELSTSWAHADQTEVML